MSTGPRQKLCVVCGKDWKIMYRIKYKEVDDWVFACKQCLLEVKKRNTHYKYGGYLETIIKDFLASLDVNEFRY